MLFYKGQPVDLNNYAHFFYTLINHPISIAFDIDLSNVTLSRKKISIHNLQSQRTNVK